MNKPLLGIVVGLILGAIDGACAWFYEEVRAGGFIGLLGIIGGSTFKGVVSGLVAGLVARKSNSLGLGIGSGLIVGLVLAYLVVYMGTHSTPPDPAVANHPYAIIIPGAIVGALCGFACVRYGKGPAVTA